MRNGTIIKKKERRLLWVKKQAELYLLVFDSVFIVNVVINLGTYFFWAPSYAC